MVAKIVEEVVGEFRRRVEQWRVEGFDYEGDVWPLYERLLAAVELLAQRPDEAAAQRLCDALRNAYRVNPLLLASLQRVLSTGSATSPTQCSTPCGTSSFSVSWLVAWGSPLGLRHGGTPASPTASQMTDETPTDGGTNDLPTGLPRAARRSDVRLIAQFFQGGSLTWVGGRLSGAVAKRGVGRGLLLRSLPLSLCA